MDRISKDSVDFYKTTNEYSKKKRNFKIYFDKLSNNFGDILNKIEYRRIVIVHRYLVDRN